MTENEAKTRWCPFARSVADNATANRQVRNGSPDIDCFCLGSTCMAWRWRPEQILFNPKTKELKPMVRGDSYYGIDFMPIDTVSATDGFCGLAGKP